MTSQLLAKMFVNATLNSDWSHLGASTAELSCWFTPNDPEVLTLFPCEEQKVMKRATTLQKPKSFKARAKDSDNPPWTEEMLGPPVLKKGRGPQRAPTKVQTTIRLDADVLAYFRAAGPGYQTQINDALRRVVKRGLTSRSSGRRTA